MVFLCPCEVCLGFLHVIRRVIIRIILLFLLLWAVVAGAVLPLWFFQDRRADLDRRGLEAANKLEELLADKQLWKVSQGLQGARQFQDTFAPDESA